MIRTYNVEIALEYGLESAIVLSDLQYKQNCQYARTIDKDGRFWVVIDRYGYEELTPMFIDKAITTLAEAGFIVVKKGVESGYQIELASVVKEKDGTT